jgi:hypothetical protein
MIAESIPTLTREFQARKARYSSIDGASRKSRLQKAMELQHTLTSEQRREFQIVLGKANTLLEGASVGLPENKSTASESFARSYRELVSNRWNKSNRPSW